MKSSQTRTKRVNDERQLIGGDPAEIWKEIEAEDLRLRKRINKSMQRQNTAFKEKEAEYERKRWAAKKATISDEEKKKHNEY